MENTGKIKVFKVKLFQDAAPFVCTPGNLKIRDLIDDIVCLDAGDALTVECKEMTQAEIDALPEWDGP